MTDPRSPEWADISAQNLLHHDRVECPLCDKNVAVRNGKLAKHNHGFVSSKKCPVSGMTRRESVVYTVEFFAATFESCHPAVRGEVEYSLDVAKALLAAIKRADEEASR